MNGYAGNKAILRAWEKETRLSKHLMNKGGIRHPAKNDEISRA